MDPIKQKISACLVVYNEEQIIERCLLSIKDLVDEIILVHDGECKDKTLEIAKKYTDKIFIREHVGEAEPHRAFAFSKSSGDWILQIDADEYLDVSYHSRILEKIENCPEGVDAYFFKWEMWNGKMPVYIKGVRKMCLFRKKNFFYCGVPHQIGEVKGGIENVDIFLHHRPLYNNTSWKEFLRKTKKWAPIHAKYFFPELVEYQCFNAGPEKWIAYTDKVRKHPIFYLIFYPLKTFLAQWRNSFFSGLIAWKFALQHYVYYVYLFSLVLRMNNNLTKQK